MAKNIVNLFGYKPFKAERGAVAVEFALVFPLLILLMFSIVEFGLYLFNRQVITNACREGARFGVVARTPRLSNGEIIGEVLRYSKQHMVTFGSDILNSADIIVKPIDNDFKDGFDPGTHRCTNFGCELEVQADYIYQFLFLSTIGITTQKITFKAIMQME